VPDLVSWARTRELDFLALTDQNTVSGHAALHALASDDLLTLGGMEMTTHHGHAVTLGAVWSSFRKPSRGLPSSSCATAAKRFTP
jgi:predicted metal-dependent phosphoesterase TrpH